ncbi:hypothetical protein GFK82_00113 [Candidatus Steffania adelgidicola]|nr:hypothetical protein GFK82_00113 [Candidatus Steffania adelgidicola]
MTHNSSKNIAGNKRVINWPKSDREDGIYLYARLISIYMASSVKKIFWNEVMTVVCAI